MGNIVEIGWKCGKLRFEWGLELVEKKIKKGLQIIKCLIFNKLNKLPEFVQYKFIHCEKFFLKCIKQGCEYIWKLVKHKNTI